MRDLPLNHTSQLGGILLQVGPSLIDIDGEYRGGGVVEEVEENEGGGASVLGFCLYPINPGRFSIQYRTGADRCTPTLPR